MNARILQKYTDAAAREDDEAPGTPEPESAEDLAAFGWLRGTRDRALMLELRKRDGNILAVSYSRLERAEYDPSEGITLHLAGQRISVRGRNLNAEARPLVRLFEGIARHRVPWIRECERALDPEQLTGKTSIESIEW